MKPSGDVIMMTMAGDVHACAVDHVLKSTGVASHVIDITNILHNKAMGVR